VPYPPDRGDRITTHHFLQHLIERGDRVQVGCFAEEEADETSIATLRGMVTEVCASRLRRTARKITSLRGLFSGTSLTEVFFRDRTLQRTIDRWVHEDPPDLVYVYSSSMAQFVMGHAGPFRFMQFAELDSDKWRQYATHSRGIPAWIYRREAKRLLAFETRVAHAFSACAVVSEVERQLFEERIPGVTPIVLPNGVDVDHFATSGDGTREPHTVIFTGVMDYQPNVQGVTWFVDRCWPKIRARLADARLLVVGSRPIEAITRLSGRDGIEVTGRVEMIPPYLDRAAVAIAPLLLARGVQNKVLEAMSTALPVVASPQALQGLGDVDADTVVCADDVTTTTNAVLDLLENPHKARAMGQRAARFVRARFRWEHMYRILDGILDGIPG